MYLTVYVDESYVGPDNDRIVMSAGIGRIRQWNVWERHVRNVAKNTGIQRLHANEINHQLKKQMRGDEFKQVMTVLYNCFNEDLEGGMIVRLSQKDYRKHFRKSSFPKGERQESPYGLCFSVLLCKAVELLWQFFGEEIDQINFVVERDEKHIKEIEEIYFRYKNKEFPPEVGRLLSDIFGNRENSRKDSKPIFAPDLIGWRVAGFEREKKTDIRRVKAKKARQGKQRIYVWNLSGYALRAIRQMRVQNRKKRVAFGKRTPASTSILPREMQLLETPSVLG